MTQGVDKGGGGKAPRMTKGLANFKHVNALADAIDGAGGDFNHGQSFGDDGGPKRILVKIFENVVDVADARWFYGWAEVYKTGKGYAGWTAVGEDPEYDNFGYANKEQSRACNFAEVLNTASSPGAGLGTSIPDGWKLQPIPQGTICWLYVIDVDDGTDEGTTEYWFDRPNSIDGECPTPETP